MFVASLYMKRKGAEIVNQRKVGILLSYLNIVLHAVIGFLYVPLLLYYIGKNEYGLYQLMGSLIAYFSIMDFGLSSAVIQFYVKYKTLRNHIGMENILAIAIRGYAAVTVFVLSVGAICYIFLDKIFGASMTPTEITEAKEIFLLLLLNIVITLSTMVFRSVINACQRFAFLKGMETIQLVLQPFLVVVVLMQHPSAFSVAAVQTVLNILLSFARVYYCYHVLHVKICFHYWNHELFVEFRKLALSVFAVTLIDQIFGKTNQVILGIVSGTAEVAVYSIAAMIYMNYEALSYAISGVYLPHVSSMVANKESPDSLSRIFIQIGRWQYYLLALVFTGFIIFGHEFIHIWAGNGFEESYWITILIILPFTIDLIQNLGLSILQAMNRYDFRAKIYFCVGVLNLLLAIPLGIRFGGVGCAVATGLSMFLGNGIIMNLFYAKEIHLAIASFWKQIGRISIVVFGCMLIGYITNMIIPQGNIITFLLKVVFYISIYLFSIYKFAFNEEEREKVYQGWMKIRISR